jgi:hypothetical protein
MPATSFAFWATVSVGVSQSVSKSLLEESHHQQHLSPIPPPSGEMEFTYRRKEEKKKRGIE